MFDLMNEQVAFADWLAVQLRERGWSQAELARRANVAQPTISRVLSGENQAGEDLARGIARAFKLDPVVVMTRAGILDEYGEILPEVRAWSRRLARLPADERAVVQEMVEKTLDMFELMHRKHRT